MQKFLQSLSIDKIYLYILYIFLFLFIIPWIIFGATVVDKFYYDYTEKECFIGDLPISRETYLFDLNLKNGEYAYCRPVQREHILKVGEVYLQDIYATSTEP